MASQSPTTHPFSSAGTDPVMTLRDQVVSGKLRDAAIFGHALCQAGSTVPEAWNLTGYALFMIGEMEAGVAHAQQAVALAPDKLDLAVDLGAMQALVGKDIAAVETLRGVLARQPDHVGATSNLALALINLEQYDEARQLLEPLLRREPNNAKALAAMGKALFSLELTDEAEPVLRKALKIDPQNDLAAHNLADLLVQRGELTAARPLYLAVIRRQPNNASALLGLVNISDRPLSPAHADLLEAVARDRRAPFKAQKYAHFALGRDSERRRNYEKAFLHFDLGHRCNRVEQNLAYPADQYDRLDADFEAMVASEPYRAALASAPERSSIKPTPSDRSDCLADQETEQPRLIFILGMPRSGSTLIEQILSSHSRVFGAGELPFMRDIALDLVPVVGDRLDVSGLSKPDLADRIARHRQDYLDRVETMAGGAPVIIDKMPHNFEHLWAIALLFPEARIVHSRRCALDTCLSIFSQSFRSGHIYGESLEWLAHHYRHYRRKMALWERSLPFDIHHQDYEALVADPQAQVPELLAACGLDFEPACLSFHTNRRVVRTASVTQVRQPVYTSSVSKWRRYEKQLQPLIRMIGPDLCENCGL